MEQVRSVQTKIKKIVKTIIIIMTDVVMIIIIMSIQTHAATLIIIMNTVKHVDMDTTTTMNTNMMRDATMEVTSIMRVVGMEIIIAQENEANIFHASLINGFLIKTINSIIR